MSKNDSECVGSDYLTSACAVLVVAMIVTSGGGKDDTAVVALNVRVDGGIPCARCYVLNAGLCRGRVVGDVRCCVATYVSVVSDGEFGRLMASSVLMRGPVDVSSGGWLPEPGWLPGSYAAENAAPCSVYFGEAYV